MAIYYGTSKKKLKLGASLVKCCVDIHLPKEYQAVEYIAASSGVGAYMNLGFAFDTKAKIEMGLYIDETSTTYPFGAAENSGALRCMLTAPYNSTKLSAYGSTGTAFNGVQTVTFTQKTLVECEMIFEKGNLKLTNKSNGETGTANTQAEYTMTSNMYLFAQNYNGSARYGGARRIHYFRYWDKNDKLICDLIPCYRKSDGVIGMYDIVRRAFLINIGSGSFTKGANVT